jgi:Domain of unknown function (DUF6980)
VKNYCCADFRHFATYRCDQHANPYECNDYVIVHDARRRQYGIIVYDMGIPTYTYLVINNCPWCGAQLYKRRRPVRRVLDFAGIEKFESAGDVEEAAMSKAPERGRE